MQKNINFVFNDMTELPIYQVAFDPEDMTQGVYGVSLVDEPAIGVDFIALKADAPIQIKLQNKDKQTVVGPVLIPNQKIYRNQGGREFYLTFDAPTIELLSQEFLKRGFHKNSFYNHDESEKLNLSVVESWITGENDKSKELGYDLPMGTWMISMKLSDGDWKEYVKSGKVKGFSIDSFLDMKEIQMHKLRKAHSQYIKMLEETNSIKVDGVEIHYMGALEEGNYLTDKEGNPIQASFEYMDYKYTTDFSGKIVEVNEVQQNIENQEMEELDKAAIIAEVMAVLEKAGIKIEDMMPAVEIEVESPEMPEMPEEVAAEDVETVEEAEKAVMEEMPKEDEELVEMKKRIQALEDKLKMAEEENMKLKKAPAATKLSQVIPTEVKQKESTMDVISRLAKLSQK